ncbi:T-complex protein 1 subunit beta [Podochytrium sp. JEL0797]|nr:T-complex protein 1 subunit beta [Podochytrium sp. JEL0797]
MSAVLPALVASTQTTRLVPHTFFIAWNGVLTLAFTGFPAELVSLKDRISTEFGTTIPPENPGSKWPKMSLGALNDGKHLSSENVDQLNAICTQMATNLFLLQDEFPVTKVSYVVLGCASLERIVLRVDMELKGGAGNAEVSQEQIESVDKVLKESEDKEAYLVQIQKPGHRASHYKQHRVEATLVTFLGGNPDVVAILDQFREAVDFLLPGYYRLGPVNIFSEGGSEERAEHARLASFVGAIAVGDLVKSTLGPKGMDKVLQSLTDGSITVTNDGATILKSIALDNAAAKVLVNISKVQDDEVGDGTTSVCVLAAELLREAERLIGQKIHPQTIVEGFRIASHAAMGALEKSAIDNSKSEDLFRQDLINIAKTTLSSKVLSQDKEYFAALAVDAVLRLKGSTSLEHIQIIKKIGGKLMDSYLDEGFILDKKIGVNQPKRIENAKILIANTPMDTDKIKIFGARVRVDATGKLAELERAEKDKMKEKVEKIKNHGINCFINRQLIYNWPEQLFADSGITAIEHADFVGIERLALVLGGEIASTFDHPELVKLGSCKLIEEVIIGEDRLIKFSGVASGQACTVVLRGATHQLLDEAERSLHDALCVLSQTVAEPRTVLGGGCSECLMAKAVDDVARTTEGKKAMAVEGFARALRQLPTILADNAGYDSSDLVTQLRARHNEGMATTGLDMYNGCVADVKELGITESFKLKRQVLLSASEAAEMILRVDNIIRAAPRQRQRQ